MSQFGLAELAEVDREVNMELDAFLHWRDGLLQQSWESYAMMNKEQLSIYDRIFNSRRHSTNTIPTAPAARSSTSFWTGTPL